MISFFFVVETKMKVEVADKMNFSLKKKGTNRTYSLQIIIRLAYVIEERRNLINLWICMLTSFNRLKFNVVLDQVYVRVQISVLSL